MSELPDLSQVFSPHTEDSFLKTALQVFRYQYENNKLYRDFCQALKRFPDNVKGLHEIPFLPIEFFKTQQVYAANTPAEIVFTSSGTGQTGVSAHHVAQLSVYTDSFTRSFAHFYGDVSDYCILALLPAYLDRQGSSLVYMVQQLMQTGKNQKSAFFNTDYDKLFLHLQEQDKAGQKCLLIGVSFALLAFAEKYALPLKHTIIMETGGMKGRGRELTRPELHEKLSKAFGVSLIHSEYGMTEMLSQAYSSGDGLFKTPPWLKILARETTDPLNVGLTGKTGGINVIDLANIYSCSFIATQDLGRVYPNGSFEITGRFDFSEIRGCNLLMN